MNDWPSIFDDDAPRARVTRGSGLLTADEANRYAARFPGPMFRLLNVNVPLSQSYRGVVIQGAQGSGKTLSILRFLLRVLEQLGRPGCRERLIVVDRKGDVVEAILGLAKALCPGVPVRLLNPFDRFGWSLDPHEFTGDPTKIVQLVHALTFRRRDARSDDFFDNTARSYLVLLVKILQSVAKDDWGWRTFFHLATSYDLLERVVKASPLGRAKSGAIVKKTFAGVVSTIDSWLSEYESAFACWEKSPKLRLEECLRGRGIILVSAPEDQVEVLQPITRLLLRVVKDRLLADTGRDAESRTTIVLDEFADHTDLVDILMPFFGRSRSAKVCLILAWQSWPAVCFAHSEQRMKAVLDNAAIRLFMGAGADSAELASTYLGSPERVRPEHSASYGSGGFLPTSRTVSYRREQVRNVLASEVAGFLPPTDRDLTVRGYLSANHLPGPVLLHENYAPLVAFLNRIPRVKPFRQRPLADLTMRPWDDATDGRVLDPLMPEE